MHISHIRSLNLNKKKKTKISMQWQGLTKKQTIVLNTYFCLNNTSSNKKASG